MNQEELLAKVSLVLSRLVCVCLFFGVIFVAGCFRRVFLSKIALSEARSLSVPIATVAMMSAAHQSQKNVSLQQEIC